MCYLTTVQCVWKWKFPSVTHSLTLDFYVVFESNASAHFLKSQRKILYDTTNQINTWKETFLIFINTKPHEFLKPKIWFCISQILLEWTHCFDNLQIWTKCTFNLFLKIWFITKTSAKVKLVWNFVLRIFSVYRHGARWHVAHLAIWL